MTESNLCVLLVLSLLGCSTASPGIPELYLVEIDIPDPPSTLRVGHYSNNIARQRRERNQALLTLS